MVLPVISWDVQSLLWPVWVLSKVSISCSYNKVNNTLCVVTTTLCRLILIHTFATRTTWDITSLSVECVEWQCIILSWLMVSDITTAAVAISVVYTAYFIWPFYKMMLKKKVTLNDMQSVVSIATCVCVCVLHGNCNIVSSLYRMWSFTTVFVTYWKTILNLSAYNSVLPKNFLVR